MNSTLLPCVTSTPNAAPGGITPAGSGESPSPADISSGANFKSVIEKLQLGKPAKQAPNGNLPNTILPPNGNPAVQTPENLAPQPEMSSDLLALIANATPSTGLSSTPTGATKSSTGKTTPENAATDSSPSMTGLMMLMLASIQATPQTPVKQSIPTATGSSDVPTIALDSNGPSTNLKINAPSAETTPTEQPTEANAQPLTGLVAPQQRLAPSTTETLKAQALPGMIPVKPETFKLSSTTAEPQSHAANGKPIEVANAQPVQPTDTVATSSTLGKVEKTPLSTGEVVAASNPPLFSDTGNTEKLQSIDKHNVTTDPQTQILNQNSTGTSNALSKERMNNSEEKNKFAGRTEQKLPSDAKSGDFATVSRSVSGNPAKTTATSSNKSLIESSPLSTVWNGDRTQLSQVVSSDSTNLLSPLIPTTPVEKLSQLIGQQVVTVRKSGLKELAVALKVDAKTELFLRITNHDGKIQATVQCEKGSDEELNKHWSELQASLARQDIQLVPVGKAQETLSANNSSGSSVNDFSQSGQSQSQAGNGERQPATGNLRNELSSLKQTSTAKDKSQPTSKKPSGAQGWESWA